MYIFCFSVFPGQAVALSLDSLVIEKQYNYELMNHISNTENSLQINVII